MHERETRVEGGGIEPVVPTRCKVLLGHLVVWREQIRGRKAAVGVKLARRLTMQHLLAVSVRAWRPRSWIFIIHVVVLVGGHAEVEQARNGSALPATGFACLFVSSSEPVPHSVFGRHGRDARELCQRDRPANVGAARRVEALLERGGSEMRS